MSGGRSPKKRPRKGPATASASYRAPGSALRQATHAAVTAMTRATEHRALTQRFPHDQDFLVTPGGKRRRESVRLLHAGEIVHHRGGKTYIVQASTGSRAELVRPGEADPDVPDAIIGNWIACTYWINDTGSAFTSFSTTWTVPPPPAQTTGQHVYFFNGIQNSARTSILQPVLQWGVSHAGGGAEWAIASWFIDPNGNVVTSPKLVSVASGDVIVGIIDAVPSGTDGEFAYTCGFQGIPDTLLPAQTDEELTGFCEVLEAADIQSCANYPPAGTLSFSSIHLTLASGAAPLQWSPNTLVPDCASISVVDGSATNGRVDLTFKG